MSPSRHSPQEIRRAKRFNLSLDPETPFELLPACYQAMEVFLTQTFAANWVRCPMSGQLQGLNWQKIESILNLKNQRYSARIIEQIEYIESGVIQQDDINRQNQQSNKG